jgi:iron complex transport system ATP-binding protein
MLEARGLCFSRAGVAVLSDVSVEFPSAKVSVVLGPNGSGKTTLLKCIAGLLPIARGKVFWDGEDVAAMSCVERARRLALVEQDSPPGGRLSVFDAVLLGRRAHFGSRAGKEDLQQVVSALEALSIEAIAMRALDTLSGGQRQIVWLARAFCQNAPIILLDEPTANLDIKNTLAVCDVLERLAQEGRTVAVVSHELSVFARVCSSFLLLKNGRTVGGGCRCPQINELAELFEVNPTRIAALV